MELTFSELKKRDVINIADGKCLGRITDIKFRFPEGRIEGIIVPGRKTCSLFNFFSKTTLYISERNIIRIGGDVILVNLSCGGVCDQFVNVDNKKGEKNEKCSPPKKNCPPPCPPPCNPCPPPCPPNNFGFNEDGNFGEKGGGFNEINFDDY